MKKKILVSSLVTLGMVVSLFANTFAENIKGEFTSKANNDLFYWSYSDTDKAILIVRENTLSGSTLEDYSSVAPDVKKMDIQCAQAIEYYKFSDFTNNLNNLNKINVRDNCTELIIKNTCPKLEYIYMALNDARSIHVDLTKRTGSIIPKFYLNDCKADYVYVDFSYYTGSKNITIPQCYGFDPRIDYTFFGSSIQSVSFAAATELIPEDAFRNCNSLTSVTIPSTVTTIEYSAFKNCPNLTTIDIPESVKTLRFNAFKNSGLKTINYGGTRAKWYGLVQEIDNDGLPVEGGNVLNVDNVVVHCSDGDLLIRKIEDHYYGYIQNDYGWIKENGKWRYYAENGGYYYNCIQHIDGNYYGFDSTGAMITGWKKAEDNIHWYFFDRLSGAQQWNTWAKDGGNWYYFDNNGYMLQNGWRMSGSNWYYLKSDGVMATGWQQIGGLWYLFNDSGLMQRGWKQVSGKWYYFDQTSGAMLTGWQQIGGKWYFLKSSGAMAANEWCGGYWLNADGTWTYKYKATWRKTNNKWWFGDDSGWYAKNETLIIDGVSYKFDAKGYLV